MPFSRFSLFHATLSYVTKVPMTRSATRHLSVTAEHSLITTFTWQFVVISPSDVPKWDRSRIPASQMMQMCNLLVIAEFLLCNKYVIDVRSLLDKTILRGFTVFSVAYTQLQCSASRQLGFINYDNEAAVHESMIMRQWLRLHVSECLSVMAVVEAGVRVS